MKLSNILGVFPSFFAIFLLFASSLEGQDIDPAVVKAKILAGDSFTWQIHTGSTGPAQVLRAENLGAGQYQLEEQTSNFVYDLVYTSDLDFHGQTRFLVEYYNFISQQVKVYTEVIVDVVPSLLTANRDLVVMETGVDEITIDVLANDDEGNGSTRITDIDFAASSQVSIVDNKIVFRRNGQSSGQKAFSYTIEDESGYSSTNVVSVNMFDGSVIGQTIEYRTSALVPVDILLDDSSCEAIATTFDLGELTRTGDHSFVFTPKHSAIGVQEIVFANAVGEEVTAQIHIQDDGISSYAVQDDEVYTAVNQPVTFDPRSNDFNEDGVISGFSSDLTYDGEKFTYQPPDGFEGVKTLYYNIVDGVKELTGTIEVYVGNYMPSINEASFSTFQNTPFIMTYDAPISNYTWSLLDEPFRGVVRFGSTFSFPTCSGGNIEGENMIIYEPHEGQQGMDFFTIEYCVNGGGPCATVDVQVNIRASSDCHCVGPNCVWPGDADNDGQVDVEDLLAIGFNYGAIGPERNNNIDWEGQTVSDWAFDQDNTDVNNKFADANGDGIVNHEDVFILQDYMNDYHDLNSLKVLSQKEVPLRFIDQGDGTYEAGDVVVFDVMVGNVQLPVTDLKGLVFEIVLPEQVEVESTTFTPTTGWIDTYSPVISTSNIKGSSFSAAISRTADYGIFGDGKIGELRLIVIESIDGYIPSDSPVEEIEITLGDAKMTNSKSKKFQVQTEPITLKIKSSDTADSFLPKVITYPNPSTLDITFHANGGDIIKDIAVFNTVGGQVAAMSNIGSQTYQYQHNLAEGMYLARITTDKGAVTERFQVISVR